MNSNRPPLIGLSVYSAEDKFHYFPHDYINAVRRAGGLPVLIPPAESNFAELVQSLDGIILTGGGDINPQRYNGDTHACVYWINDQQDRNEFALARHALEYQKPLLATCRGMQIINVLLGGTLHAHLPEVYGDNTPHRHAEDAAIEHSIELLQDCKLAQMLETNRFLVKSWHHQAIDKIADNFTAVGYAPDGAVEAIESDQYPNLIAVQWHPEISAKDDPLQQKLFDGWLQLYIKKD